MITNLADELTLVDRMADALAGEIMRRQEILRAAGNLASVTDYAAARRARPELPPLPALLVVVDEFSELLAQRPELIDLMVTIGRLGRSLGLHLLLASQRLDEGRLRGLESHLSYRIALRTFSAPSRAPCSACRTRTNCRPRPARPSSPRAAVSCVRFRAAYVSGPPRARPGAVAGGAGTAAGPTASGSGRWATGDGSAPPPRGAPGRRPRCSTRSSPRWPGGARRRTGSGCPRWTRRRP